MESDLFPEESKAQDKDEKKKRLEMAQLLEDFRRTFETAYGKRVFKYIIEERCHVLSPIMVPSSYIYFREGERNVGLWMLSMREMATIEGIESLRGEI